MGRIVDVLLVALIVAAGPSVSSAGVWKVVLTGAGFRGFGAASIRRVVAASIKTSTSTSIGA